MKIQGILKKDYPWQNFSTTVNGAHTAGDTLLLTSQPLTNLTIKISGVIYLATPTLTPNEYNVSPSLPTLVGGEIIFEGELGLAQDENEYVTKKDISAATGVFSYPIYFAQLDGTTSIEGVTRNGNQYSITNPNPGNELDISTYILPGKQKVLIEVFYSNAIVNLTFEEEITEDFLLVIK